MRKWTVVGSYADSGQTWVEYSEGETALDGISRALANLYRGHRQSRLEPSSRLTQEDIEEVYTYDEWASDVLVTCVFAGYLVDEISFLFPDELGQVPANQIEPTE